ncbi:MAG TPA: hypothetical protein VF910_00935 [Candidatus Bathyarchaeia archaeon]
MSASNGKRFIEKLVAASPLERRKITVLGQDIYFTPLTRKALADAMPKDEVEREPDYVGLFVLVHCAEAEDGSKLFEIRDIDALRERVSVQLLQQIEQAMMETLLPSPEQVVAVVNTDPPSASA